MNNFICSKGEGHEHNCEMDFRASCGGWISNPDHTGRERRCTQHWYRAKKTEKQCKADKATCDKDCDQLIDIDNNIQRCKDRCTDAYLLCLPLRSSGGGGTFTPPTRPGQIAPPTVSPPKMPRTVAPGMTGPIQRRGVEGDQPAEPAPGTSGQSEPSSGKK